MARSMSRGEIHRRSGYSLAHISKIYGGTRRPSMPCLEMLAKVQGKTLDEVQQDIRKDAALEAKKRRRRVA